MSTYTISETARVPAPAASCYAVISDYRVGHPAIVPPRAFGPIEVEEGGVGAGTRIRFTMRALGQERVVRGDVTEPEPGRVIVETYPESGIVTSFIVDAAGDAACDVTITSVIPSPAGLRGTLERWFTRAFLGRLYKEELGRLAAYVQNAPIAGAAEATQRATSSVDHTVTRSMG